MYLSFRIQYIASQVALPEDIIYVNTMVFGSYSEAENFWSNRSTKFSSNLSCSIASGERH